MAEDTGGVAFFPKDLDEVQARYLEPLSGNIRAVLGHRKFVAGGKDAVDQKLTAEKRIAPKTYPWALAVDREHPGFFLLAFLIHSLVHEVRWGGGPLLHGFLAD